MRTTLTLDPDVAEKIRQAGLSGKRSQKEIINEALRRGFADQGEQAKAKPFRVKTFHSPFRTGIDPGRLNQLVDELEVESQLEGKLHK
ncbi:MAG: type II toxin-antitoxin system antitoxin VapB33 [Opitutales bacterium]